MKLSIQFKRKKDPIRDLEQYFQYINKGFKRQISNLNAEHYYQNSRKQFYAFLNSADKKIKQEEKKFLKQAWVKDIKKGRFLSKRTKTLKHWYNDNSPTVYKIADQGFDKIEKTIETGLEQSKKWVDQKTPEVRKQIRKHYKSLARELGSSMNDYYKSLKKPSFKATLQLTIENQ
jgi:hypothetical protein